MELHQPIPGFGLQSMPSQQPFQSNTPSLQDLTTNLTIRLINNTRILLPITGCQTIVENLSNIDGLKESLDVCSVEWSQVRLLHNFLNGNEATTRTYQVSSTRIINTWKNRSTESTLEFLRYLHLSINSFLAVCGILANFFILLILVFNFKQRRRSTGSNMAAKNNLLLFQLTFTGIILATYILIDNMNICTQINHFAGFDSEELCRRPLLDLPDPLLTFLPKTYFHWTTKVNQDSISEITTSPVITLEYNTNVSLNEIDSNDYGSSKFIDIRHNLKNHTKRFNLSSDSLKISTSISTCIKKEKEKLNLSGVNSHKLMLIMGALPLIINILASAHIWTVAALAYDRYRAIAHPFQYLSSVHTSRTKTVFVLSWFILLSLNLVLPITVNDRNIAYQSEVLEGRLMTHWYSWLIESIRSIYKFKSIESIQKFSNNSYCSIGSMKEVESDNSASTLAKNLGLYLRNADKISDGDMFIGNNFNMEIHVIMLIVLSFMGFLAVILLPLIIITVCNIGIYRIVKVHERRLSFSSSTTVAASNPCLQQQMKQPSSTVEANGHQQMMIRPEIAHQESINDKQIPMIRRIIKVTMYHKKRKKMQSTESNPKTSSQDEQDIQQSPESLDSPLNNSSSGSLGQVSHGAISKNRSVRPLRKQDHVGLRGSCGDISRYRGIPRRVSTGEESYYENELISKDISLINCEGSATIHRFLSSVSSSPTAQQRSPMKFRKTSDSGLVMTGIKDYTDSTQQHMSDTDLESATLSNSPSCLLRDCDSSGSILNQLKLAGLSFAGIAIQSPSPNPNSRRPLHKSSSTCSFGGSQSNLNWNHRQHVYDQFQSSRSSYDSSFGPIPTKRSYVSLSGSLKQYEDLSPTKYKTKLIEEPQATYTTPTHSSNRLTLTFGTKSAIFNILVWLIITLLLFTLPHYIFSISKPITKLSFFRNAIHLEDFGKEFSHTNSLCRILKLFGEYESTAKEVSCIEEKYQFYFVDRYFGNLVLESITIFLACLCRILFLIIIPLNGCLYGFSSRSFRTTIKMILKRYISRKQASIEINQRHRPFSSTHQRASSCSNVTSLAIDCGINVNPKTELGTRESTNLLETWKSMKLPKLRSKTFFRRYQRSSQNESIRKNKETFITPEISLDDSYCRSQSVCETNDSSLLSNSFNSSFSLACSVVDIEDVSKLRNSRSTLNTIKSQKHLSLERNQVDCRVRAASLSSLGNYMSKSSRTHPPAGRYNFHSKRADNILFSGYLVDRINKHRHKKPENSRLANRNGKARGRGSYSSKDPKSSSNTANHLREDTASIWERIREGLCAIFVRDGLQFFRNNKGTDNQGLDEQLSENQSNVALLSRNNLGNQQERNWFGGSNRHRNLGNSPTFSSIESVKSGSIAGIGCCVMRPPVLHSKENPKSLETPNLAIQDKKILYLKPPNFLKLSLDVGAHINHNYRITSTLSPIRESSSNHSYASSQSSLAINNSKSRTWLAALQDTPMKQTLPTADCKEFFIGD